MRTDLPPPVAVGPAEHAEAAGNDEDAVGRHPSERPLPGTPEVKGEFVRDFGTKDLVFRWVDVQSGEVVQQFPDEAVLRVRALMDTWSRGQPSGRTAAYDVTA